MKHLHFLISTIMALVLIAAGVTLANAATIATPEQIAAVAAAATDGEDGDVGELVEEYMNTLTASLLTLDLTPEEIRAQIAIAIQELTSTIPTDLGNFQSIIADALDGGVQGAIQAVNAAVAAGDNPNLDPVALTDSVTRGVADAVQILIAANPDLDTATLVAAVNDGAVAAGASAIEPEAFEPAGDTAGATPDDTPAAGPTIPGDAPTVEAPPTQDDRDPSPV